MQQKYLLIFINTVWEYVQQYFCHLSFIQINFPCVAAEGAACLAEKELGIQLEEWDAPPLSAMEDSLLFESKNMIYRHLQWQYQTVQTYGIQTKWTVLFTSSHNMFQ